MADTVASKEGIARVFFPQGGQAPAGAQMEVGFQLLSHHQGLVAYLLEQWQFSPVSQPLKLWSRTRDLVLEAARYHDDGKRLTFKIKQENGRLTYSFSGHRFRLAQEVKDPYVQALIWGHHDYSTREVINLASQFPGDLARRFPEDLFLLMMADQLEAELAVRLFEGKSGELRPFVEFDLLPDEDGVSYYLDPWPFKEQEVELHLEAFFHPLQAGEPGAVEDLGRKLVQGGAHDALASGFRVERRSARLRPWGEAARGPLEAKTFYGYFQMTPQPWQEEFFQKVRDASPEEVAYLLLAPTGSGKTEAVAFPALARGDRLVFVLPTRSLIDDLEGRFSRYLKTLAQIRERPKALVVDTGHRQARRLFRPDGREEMEKGRHLYHADVILTTLDKLLYRYFGYAEGVKSYVFPRRIHDRRTLFVFDEVHLYEATAWVNFRNLLTALYEGGVRLVVMSATMPEVYKRELPLKEPLKVTPGKRPSRKLLYVPQGNPFELARDHFRDGKRVLLVVEEVKEAAELYRKLKEELGQGVFLYHGRLADSWRRKVFEDVKVQDKEKRAYLLVTTPAIEVGVDLDAEVLVTSLCPPENLIQRMGRVNRRGLGEGVVFVVGEEYPGYLGQLPSGYTDLLKELSGSDLGQGGEERLKEAIFYPRYVDPRAEALFLMLHEYVYEQDLTQEPLHRKGFIATRSWTPSVRLRHHDAEVEVPVDQLVGREVEPVGMKERVWSDREGGGRAWEEREPRSGELYGRELVLDYPYPYEEEVGFVQLPKVFRRIRHPDPQRVLLLWPGAGDEQAVQGKGVLSVEADQPLLKRKGRVFWYLADSAWAEGDMQEEGDSHGDEVEE